MLSGDGGGAGLWRSIQSERNAVKQLSPVYSNLLKCMLIVIPVTRNAAMVEDSSVIITEGQKLYDVHPLERAQSFIQSFDVLMTKKGEVKSER